jgi:hypothetical protein
VTGDFFDEPTLEEVAAIAALVFSVSDPKPDQIKQARWRIAAIRESVERWPQPTGLSRTLWKEQKQ